MAEGKGNNAQFTYDFGIAIAQSTVSKIMRLTGASLTLASAFYALKSSAEVYVKTLRENTLRFGGVLSTMKAMEQAQDRLIKGQSYFSVDDQLKGMEQLKNVGVDVGKNMEWINKSAHAVGKSYSEFSGMIASAIQGNSQALVSAGLMTQRATKMFDKYEANTVMRQQAILNFVKNHKGLMNAVKNDFETAQDQIIRINATWKSFISAIVGKPNDPQSLYGQVTSALKMVATSFSESATQLKRYGFIIGQVLGWVIKQVGHFVVWIGRKVKGVLESVWSVTDDFQTQARSLVVWLEFWKLKVIDFFKEYKSEIKMVLGLLIAYKLLKTVFNIGNDAVKSVMDYKDALMSMFKLQNKYLKFMGPAIGNKFTRWLQSLAVFMPKSLRKVWVSVGKFFERGIFGGDFTKFFKTLGKSLFGLKPLFNFLFKGMKLLFGIVKNLPSIVISLVRAGKALVAVFLGSNPIGWIMLIITLLVTLYAKCKSFRVFLNNFFKMIVESLKLIWNSLMYLVTWVMIGCKKIWGWFKEYIWYPISNFFSAIKDWISEMWDKFKDTTVGIWIDKFIVSPLKKVFQWIANIWDWVVGGIGKVVNWLSDANTNVSQATKELAEEHGVKALPTFSGGNYNTNDDTNYLNPKNWGSKDKDTPQVTKEHTRNPIITNSKSSEDAISMHTSMNFNSGAIQIVVQKGDTINERILAQKIKGIINDLRRNDAIRGGEV